MPTANKYISASEPSSTLLARSKDTVIAVLDMSWICGIISSFLAVEIAVANNGFEKAIGNVHLFKLPILEYFFEKYFPPCRKWFSQKGGKADNYG